MEKNLLSTGFVFLLIVIAWVDIRRMKIPDCLVGAILVLGILSGFTVPQISILQRLGGMGVVGLLFLWAATWRPGSLGGGDIKLAVAGALYLGPDRILWAVFGAAFFAAVYGLFLTGILKYRTDTKYALGPFLCAGMLCASLLENIL